MSQSLHLKVSWLVLKTPGLLSATEIAETSEMFIAETSTSAALEDKTSWVSKFPLGVSTSASWRNSSSANRSHSARICWELQTDYSSLELLKQMQINNLTFRGKSIALADFLLIEVISVSFSSNSIAGARNFEQGWSATPPSSPAILARESRGTPPTHWSLGSVNLTAKTASCPLEAPTFQLLIYDTQCMKPVHLLACCQCQSSLPLWEGPASDQC